MEPIRLYKYRWYFRIGWLETLLVLKTIDYYFFDCSYSFPRLAMFILFILSLLICFLEEYNYKLLSSFKFSVGLIEKLFSCMIIGATVTFVSYLCLSIVWPEKPYNGASIIRPANIEERRSTSNGRGSGSPFYKVSFSEADSIRHDIVFPKKETDKLIITYRLECKEYFEQYPYGFYSKQELKDSIKIYLSYVNQVHEFAFLQGKKFYTYHDFAMVRPNFTYAVVGFYVVYKATPTIINDSLIKLTFMDCKGKMNVVSKKVDSIDSIPDTFLVFHNINEKMSKEFTVCAPEINTPENWAKISDYGYIFHYDVYSKEEIESKCPQIRNYVEKYKERNTEK